MDYYYYSSNFTLILSIVALVVSLLSFLLNIVITESLHEYVYDAFSSAWQKFKESKKKKRSAPDVAAKVTNTTRITAQYSIGSLCKDRKMSSRLLMSKRNQQSHVRVFLNKNHWPQAVECKEPHQT